VIILIKILLAHFVGDFILEPKSWGKDVEKQKAKSYKFYVHILIHGLLVLLALWDLNYWLMAFLIMISHGIIDAIKLYAQNENNKPQLFILDQALHISSIFVLCSVFFKSEINFYKLVEDPDIWIYTLAIFFITVVSSILMKEVMTSWSVALHDSNEASLNNAGKYIGMLERIFVFTFVVTGNWEGIGFLLAAKSVFRFGDLKESKDRKLTEYILIGTLLSFGIAIAAGMLVLKLKLYMAH
jgi:hypothetical protein